MREGGIEGEEGERGKEEGETNVGAIKLCSLCCFEPTSPQLPFTVLIAHMINTSCSSPD